MKFFFYTNIAFEDWNWENSLTKGIGGSETSIVEMSWRLAARGHDVTVYAPIPKDSPNEWRKTKWYRYEDADFTQEGVWILYRCPEVVDKFPPIPKRHKQKVWFLMQDWDYPDWEKYIENTDKVITLCQAHGKYTLKNHPSIGRKLWLSSNGVKTDLIQEIEKEKIIRNPLRVMHASSPDRGLLQAIRIFRHAKEFVPELELHAFYGFDNLDKLISDIPNSPIAKKAQEIRDLIQATPGVVFHGRVSQPDLYREWMKSGIYVYITDFFETSNIASQEAQAMGAVPVFSPVFAQKENIRHGIGVEGKSEDPLTIARAAAEVVRLALQPELQEGIRYPMISWARKRFDWEVFVTQWILEAQEKREEFEKQFDFPEQLC